MWLGHLMMYVSQIITTYTLNMVLYISYSLIKLEDKQ